MAIEPRKRTRKGDPFRTETEVGELFERLQRDSLSSWEDGRLYALMLLVCSTGIHGNYALRLPVRDFDFEAGTVIAPSGAQAVSLPGSDRIYRTKRRGRVTKVKLMKFSLPPLAEWSRRCGSEWMFPGTEKSCTWAPASANKKLDAVAVEAGLPEGTSVEIVRHSVLINRWSSRLSQAIADRKSGLRVYAEPSAEIGGMTMSNEPNPTNGVPGPLAPRAVERGGTVAADLR